MLRRALLLAAAALAACAPKQSTPDLFPETVASEWRRTTDPDTAPADPIPANAIRETLSAGYEGPGKLRARAYRMASSALALDLVQRWKPAADTVFFYRDEWFVVVKWENAPRASLQAFVREVEKRLDPQSGTRR